MSSLSKMCNRDHMIIHLSNESETIKNAVVVRNANIFVLN